MSAYINDLAAADKRRLHQLKVFFIVCNSGFNIFGDFGVVEY